MSSGTAIYYACLLCRSNYISDMTNVIDVFEAEDQYVPWIPKLAPVCATVSILVSFCYQMFAFGMWDESFVEVILLSSHSLSQDILLWDWKNLTSSNDKLYEQYSDLTNTNVTLGILCFVRDFFSNLYMGMMWDLIPIVNIVMSSWKHVFLTNHVMDVLDNIKPTNSLAARTRQREREFVFKKWRAYRIVYKFVNIVFGPFLPMFHIRNVLMYAFFLGICILPDETTTAIVYVNYLYDILKAEVTYAVSSRLTQQVRKYPHFKCLSKFC